MDRRIINQAASLIGRQRLAKAINCIQPILQDGNYAELHDRLNNVRRDYELMQDYMRRGFADPERDRFYAKLLKRMHKIVSDADVIWQTTNDGFMSDARLRVSRSEVNPDVIRKKLENYVGDIAMLQFTQNEHEASQLYKEHADYVSLLFDHLVLSRQWSEGEAADYERLLTSPTIDSNDAAHLVSALTLSCYTHFDILKFRTLLAVYKEATEEVLRQRALVGWALSLRGNNTIYPEMTDMVLNVCEGNDTLRLLVETQIQMFFCLNAERDHDEIKRDILPTLMKHNNFEITRSGIIEKEDDPMEDILNPDASEQAMEEMEKSFHRMQEMQKNGSDVYFGGFSQMKRFPFFYNLSNWFCPFYLHHPALEGTVNKLKNTAFLTNLLENSPFCDSDKYSFAIALSSIVDRLPENVKSMLGSEEVFGPAKFETDTHSPAVIRLMYLQDLYRFFRLSDRRRPFRNPFGGQNNKNALFMASGVLKEIATEGEIVRLGNFLLKHDQYDALTYLLDIYKNHAESVGILMLEGALLINQGKYDEAIPLLEHAHRMAPDNLRPLALLARSYMLSERFEQALGSYTTLHEARPENRSYLLNKCIALTHVGRADEARSPLFKLNYEYPDDLNVTRVLAWVLLSSGKVEQASREYQRLLEQEHPSAEDSLNAGYCKWIDGDVQGALQLFRRYMELLKASRSDNKEDVDLADIFQRDSVMLLTNGLSPSSLLIMADMV